MQSGSGDNAPSQLGIENLAKSIGAFTAIAVGTGILFDVMFFQFVSPSFFHLMALSDHIESAARAVPFLVLLLLWLAMGWWSARLGRHWGYKPWRFPVAGMLLLTIGLWLFDDDLSNALFGAALVILLSMAIVAGVSDISQLRLLFFFAAAWFALTCVSALIHIHRLKSAARSASFHIVLANEHVITGGIIRLLDKGAIILSEPGRRYIFIPKDQIRRIDHLTQKDPG